MKTSIFDKYHVDIKDVKKSQEWFDKFVKNIDKVDTKASTLLKENNRLTTNVKPGSLYSFVYDPIGSETLPYYDVFPLVFPFHKTADTFYGLNMHYLPYKERFVLFKELLRITGSTSLTDNKKMLFKWEMVRGISKLASVQPCVKQYRFSQLKSPFIEIKPSEWTTAMLLPTHNFKKASANTVWNDSKKIRSW